MNRPLAQTWSISRVRVVHGDPQKIMSEQIRKRVVDIGYGNPWLQAPGWLNRTCFAILERIFGYHTIDGLFARAAAGNAGEHYLTRLSDVFGLVPKISGLEDCHWPQEGPVIVVANHPIGGADAVLVGDLAFRMRPDTKILSTEFLGGIEPVREMLITVDVYGGEKAARKNRRGLRETAEHLKAGGQLVIFPSGKVASWSWRKGAIAEAPWADHTVTLARKYDARIVPILVKGRNSLLFHLLGMIHPFLRTAWLGRELLGKRGKQIELIVREPVQADDLNDEDPADHLRRICFGENAGSGA